MADRDEVGYKKVESEASEPRITISEDWSKELVKIKGIGDKTAKDIGTMFKSEDELIDALNSGKVALRDDHVEILEDYFDI